MVGRPAKTLPVSPPVIDKPWKATKADIVLRVKEVQTLLLNGYTKSDIVQHGQKWKLSVSQIETYIAKATEIIQEINQRSSEQDVALLTAAMWDTFRLARASNNLTEMRQTLVAIAKFKGLEETRVNHVIEDKRNLIDVSDDYLDAILVGEDDTEEN